MVNIRHSRELFSVSLVKDPLGSWATLYSTVPPITLESQSTMRDHHTAWASKGLWAVSSRKGPFVLVFWDQRPSPPTSLSLSLKSKHKSPLVPASSVALALFSGRQMQSLPLTIVSFVRFRQPSLWNITNVVYMRKGTTVWHKFSGHGSVVLSAIHLFRKIWIQIDNASFAQTQFHLLF